MEQYKLIAAIANKIGSKIIGIIASKEICFAPPRQGILKRSWNVNNIFDVCCDVIALHLTNLFNKTIYFNVLM